MHYKILISSFNKYNNKKIREKLVNFEEEHLGVFRKNFDFEEKQLEEFINDLLINISEIIIWVKKPGKKPNFYHNI